MTYVDLGGDAPYSVVHLEGWALVRVRRDLDAASLGVVLDALRGERSPRVALDLERHSVGDGVGSVVDTVRGLVSSGSAAVVVSCDDAQREALVRGGLAQVYESLDQALEVDAPAIVFQHDQRGAALPPSAADVTVVTANDLLGPGQG